MKKILMVLVMVTLAVGPAHATTMCAADDTLTIVLDPSVGGINYKYNAELFEWQTEFPYGTIFGIATCVSTPRGAPTDILIDADSGEIATGGERLGGHCWCKMTHPVKSRWVFQGAHGSVAGCRSNCARHCGSNVRETTSVRGVIFGSVVE